MYCFAATFPTPSARSHIPFTCMPVFIRPDLASGRRLQAPFRPAAPPCHALPCSPARPVRASLGPDPPNLQVRPAPTRPHRTPLTVHRTRNDAPGIRPHSGMPNPTHPTTTPFILVCAPQDLVCAPIMSCFVMVFVRVHSILRVGFSVCPPNISVRSYMLVCAP